MSLDQDDPTPTMTPVALHPAKRRPAILVLRGSEVGSVYRLEKSEMIVGRDGGADIRLPLPTVSRRHARLRVSADRVVVEDLGSSNGTYVGFDLLEGPRQLEEGDNVGFGSLALVKLTRSYEDDSRRCRPVSMPAARVGSHAHLRELLDAEIAYARRHRAPLTLVFIRMDSVATAFSTAEAERIAEPMVGKIATVIGSVARAEEAFARWGVNELIALVRGDGWAGAALGERVRAALDAHVDFPDNPLGRQTVTGVVVPIKLLAGAVRFPSPMARGARGDEILAAARALATRSSMNVSNRVIRGSPLSV